MFLSFIIFVFPIIILTSLSYNKTNSYTYYNLISIYVILCSCYLINYGGDFPVYCEAYAYTNSLFEYILFENDSIGYSYEPLYVLLSIFLHTFTNNGEYAVTFITITSIIIIIYNIPCYSKNIILAIFLYITHFYFWIGLVFVRQTLSIIILFPIIKLLYDNKIYKSIIITILASMMHMSAIVWLCVIIFHKYNITKSKNLIYLLLIFSFIIGYMNLFTLLLETIVTYIPRGQMALDYISLEQSINIFAYTEVLILLFISLRFKKKLIKVNKYNEIAISILFISAIFAGLSLKFGIGSRFILSLNFFSFIIIIPSLISIIKSDRLNKSLYYFCFTIYMSIIFIRYIYVNS